MHASLPPYTIRSMMTGKSENRDNCLTLTKDLEGFDTAA